MVIREAPPLRLMVAARNPSGRLNRWALDEPNAENILGNPRWSSTMPGGWESADLVLAREPGVEYGDLKRLSTLTFYGPGADIIGEYRLERTPRTSGDQIAISPQAVGWQAALEDNKSASGIYVDRDMTRWGPPSVGKRLVLLDGGYRHTDPTVTPDATSGVPSVVQTLRLEGDAKPRSEAIYDAGPANRIAAIYNAWLTKNHSAADANWAAFVAVADQDDLQGSVVSSSDLAGATSGAGYFTPASALRYGALIWEYQATTVASQGVDRVMTWRTLAMYGDHGLTRRGTDPGGFYASDIVEHAVQTWAPFLNTDVSASSFVIPHLAFYDPTTAGEMVRQATRFGLQDWAVWEGPRAADPTFYWHERGERGRTWLARVAPSGLEETGPQVERLWESILVSYRDVDGSTRTVGPPGSGADTESAELKDDDPENPANQLGITRRDLLQMGTGTAASATEIGARFLEQSKLLDSSGRAKLTGYVQDDRGVIHPFWRVRAGDTIRFVDAADTRERRVVKADNNFQDLSCTVDLDAPPEGLAALLERLAVVLIPLGVG